MGGMEPRTAQARNVFNLFDIDQTNSISFDEFLTSVYTVTEKAPAKEALIVFFHFVMGEDKNMDLDALQNLISNTNGIPAELPMLIDQAAKEDVIVADLQAISLSVQRASEK